MAIPQTRTTRLDADEPSNEIRAANLASVADSSLPRARPNRAFFLVFYNLPSNWHVKTAGLDRPTWLPFLQREYVEPGSALHRTLQRHEPAARAFGRAHERIREDGGVIVPQSYGYLREMDVVHPVTGAPGVLYLDAWERPRTPVPGQRLRFLRDEEGYNRFLVRLVQEGVVPQPDPSWLAAKAARILGHADRHAAKTDLAEDVRQRLVEETQARARVAEVAAVPRPARYSAEIEAELEAERKQRAELEARLEAERQQQSARPRKGAS